MSFDPAAIRAEFPILQREVRGHPLHYLDNAATTQMPHAVLNAVHDHETKHRANVLRGVHTLAEESTEAYEQARGHVARFLSARSEEVIFTSGTTSAINLVAHSLGNTFAEGDEVIVSDLEHHSNIVPWQMLRDRKGIVLKFLPVTNEGRIDLDALDALLTARTRLVSLVHVSNVTGAELDVRAVAEKIHAVGAKLMLDGAQRMAHGPFDLPTMGADFYAFSGHKMYAPNGIGVLWARQEILEDLPPFQGGGEMILAVTREKTTFAAIPHRFEAGTPPIAQAVGLGAAVRWIESLDQSRAESHLKALTGRTLDGLATLDKGRGLIQMLGPSGTQARMPVVSFSVNGAHPHDICQMLDGFGVALRGGHHCAQILMDCFDLTGTTRASLAVYNTTEDVDALLTGLDQAISRLT
jgi:cysteine desulfurase/selenocysteine lyase